MSTYAAEQRPAERLVHFGSGWRRWPLATAGGAAIASGLVLLPIAFLIVQAQRSGLGEVERLLLRHTVATLLWNTVRLAAACTALCALLGVGAAWCVQRTTIPLRGLWSVVLVLPLGIPDFVVGFGWVSIDHGLHGYFAAVMVMTLSLYPLVYLPVATAMANVDSSLEEAARSLGLSRWRTFWRVTMRQVRPAVLGGCLLVMLALLAEYGAFEITQYRTFTVEIFTEFQLGFNAVGACVLSLVLVVIGLVVLAGELTLTGATRGARPGTRVARPATRASLGRMTVPVSLGLTALAGLALGVPLYALVYWMIKGGSTTLPPASLASALAHTAEFSAAAAALATALAIPLASLSIRHRSRLTLMIERLAFVPMALPGLVVALGLVSFTVRYALGLYQSSVELVVAYAILFLPLALVAVRAALAQAPARLEEVGRSLGCGPLAAWRRVTLPLIAPGLRAAFALVFISSATELTATLVLHPTGVNTLATQFWSYSSSFAYGAAAPYAALMVAISAVPAYLLSRRMTVRPATVSP